MRTSLQSSGLVMTPGIKAAAEEKFGRLRRLLIRFDHSDLLLHVLLARVTHHQHKGKIFRAEAHIGLGRKEVFAAVEGDDLYSAMDHCVAALKKQLVSLKEKALG